MIHDAKAEVTCDGEKCRESLFIDLPYVYTSLSGAGGHYEFKEAAINREVKSEGWSVTDDGKHYCWSCAEQQSDRDS